MKLLRLFFLAFLLVAHDGYALGTEFTYQGELRNNGTPVQGSVDLEFRLFNVAAGGTPVAALLQRSGITLNNGSFSVNLDFGDAFQGQPLWLEISVRTTGQPNFAALAPRQPVLGAPHALHADFISDNSASGSNIVDGTVQRADFAMASISTVLVLDGSIVTPDFSNNAIGTAALAGAAVTGAKLADGSVSSVILANGAVDTTELANASVTRAKIAPGAIGATQVNSSQLQLRLAGSCQFGIRPTGFSASGAPVCPAIASHVLPTNSGLWPKLALRSDERPVIAFYDADTDEIKLATCGDATCATAIVRTIDAVGAAFEGSIDLVLRADDTALIGYRDAIGEDLYGFDCSDETCANGSLRAIVVNPFNAGSGVALVLRSSELPWFVHSEIAFRITGEDCVDRGCTSSTWHGLRATGEIVAPLAAIVSTTGLPLSFAANVVDLEAVVCLNNACSADETYRLAVGIYGGLSAAMAPDGIGTLAYRDQTGTIRVLRCAGGLGVCQTGTSVVLGTGNADTGTDIAFAADGYPRVAYRGVNGISLRVCADVACATTTLRTPDPAPERGNNPSIALRADGRPVFAYEDSGQIRVTVCANVDCAP